MRPACTAWLCLIVALPAVAVALPAVAADGPADKAPTAQQMRMKDCNERAGDMKGEARKQFMSACLAGKEPAAKLTPQQERMRACNERAGDRKGEERKRFMSTCLQG